MRKIILGLVAAAAIATPLAVATSAQAAGTIPVPANPLSALVCNTLPVLPAAPEGVSWSAVTDHRALNGKVGVTATTQSGYTFANGTTTKAYAAQACLFGVPTVENGVPNYGAYANGVWKVGSKVTLESGTEFLTHGGTTSAGPPVRYRLVFTPNAGFTLPETLPGDGFKVGGSAVFHVYVVVPNEIQLTGDPERDAHQPARRVRHRAHRGRRGAYYATQIKVTVINDTNVDKNFPRIRYADLQDGNRVWVERAIFTDGVPTEVVSRRTRQDPHPRRLARRGRLWRRRPGRPGARPRVQRLLDPPAAP